MQLGHSGVRGGDSRLSSMPAYVLDYAGRVMAPSPQLRPKSRVGDSSQEMHMQRAASFSGISSLHTTALYNPNSDAVGARRYSADTPGTVALYHMDPMAPGRFLNDASANKLDADQITLQANGTPIKRDAALSFVPEACYGYSALNAACQANPQPPWCP